MKIKTIIVLLTVIFVLGGCTKSQPKTESEIMEIQLSSHKLYLDNLKTKDTIRISEGNGGYEIYNKNTELEIHIDEKIYMTPNDAYNKNKIRATVQGDSIIIVDRLYKQDTAVIGLFGLIDSKRKFTTFLVLPTGFKGEYFAAAEN